MRLIDADALKAKIEFEYDLNYGEILMNPCEFYDMVDNAPTIDAAPVVHGRWNDWQTSAYIGRDDYNEPKFADRKFYRCDGCRYGTVVESNYCPSCGARMDKE